jgi:hypothetical protein
MRRNFLTSTVAAAVLAGGSAWAAPNAGNSTTHYLNQVNEQAYQIEAQADQLEAYVRSGAHDWVSSASYTSDMAEGTQKLWALLDKLAAQPGATNETRMRVEKMKTLTEELQAFTSNTALDLGPRALALRTQDVFANTSNIEERCDLLRSAAQDLAAH